MGFCVLQQRTIKTQGMEHYSGEELGALAEAIHYQEWIAEQFRPYLHGRIMEIGAGVGTMGKKWLPYADELYLLEPAKNLFPVLQTSFSSYSNVSLHNGTLDRFISDNPEMAIKAFDAVIMINVLEHIEFDDQVLNSVNQILTSDGHLLIFVPAMPAIFGSLDKEFGHYRRYTKSGLATVCRKAGYEIINIRYFDVFGTLPWWYVNRVLRSPTLNPRMARLYDRFVVPLARYAEKLIEPPFGKNLVLVGHKTCM
jgi:SAM-dependent methyltransferase